MMSSVRHAALGLRAILALGLVFLASATRTEARSLRLTTVPPSASVFMEDASGARRLLGSGSAEVQLRRGEISKVVVEAPGWEPKVWEFSRKGRPAKSLILRLDNRMIAVVAEPPSATIFVDGNEVGVGMATVLVVKDQTVKVEVKSLGYVAVSRDYSNTQAGEAPPVSDRISLQTRVVALSVEPSEARILVDGSGVGQGTATVEVAAQKCAQVRVEADGHVARELEYCQGDGSELPIEESFALPRALVVNASPSGSLIRIDGGEPTEGQREVGVPTGGCVTVEALRGGFLPLERVFCVKEGMPEPPREITLELTDRSVRVGSSPPGARILVDGEQAGVGEFTLFVPMGSCRRIDVVLDGYLPQRRDVCYETADVYPPQVLQVDLEQDEAWAYSVGEASANHEVMIALPPGVDFDAAWRTLGVTILASFDVVEVTDRDIGYLRTAWRTHEFERSTVRTRVIVKQTTVTPVRFAVRLVSERSEDGGESFAAWARVLLDYRDLLPTLISRLTSQGHDAGPQSPAGDRTLSGPEGDDSADQGMASDG